MKRVRPTKLLWVDMEMTGLNPEKHRIVEVAAFVTDFSFKRISDADYHAVVYQPDDVLAAASDVAKQMDALNGLHDQVRREGKPEDEVRHTFAAYIRENFLDEPATLAGNSIHQDRRFIRQWWPDVDSLLHYRMLDVSSFKVLMLGKYDLEFAKKETHRALDDIQESIDELTYYLEQLQKPGAHGS